MGYGHPAPGPLVGVVQVGDAEDQGAEEDDPGERHARAEQQRAHAAPEHELLRQRPHEEVPAACSGQSSRDRAASSVASRAAKGAPGFSGRTHPPRPSADARAPTQAAPTMQQVGPRKRLNVRASERIGARKM
eukprot:CAMPEP_0206366012 /NCGR_PEP_ID=MMETSP0294-20121207/3209_1 /ASSEMBLY_ACC=CAM_ASM_000327 /TAXON_ID=39354 /ORGANISM="Heterosigma akashiwo, Strain CCMP2393" /LENGTH=132 /DNA_ID=CAMNT_0053812017 /DNA_START=321 /DNA_END=720 /DNA_ORIENTATION=-